VKEQGNGLARDIDSVPAVFEGRQSATLLKGQNVLP
jgi:hypothetical protein